MGDNTALWTVGSLSITPYSLCIAAGVLAAVLLTVLLGRKRYGAEKMLRLCLWVIPCALIGSHLVYCLARFEYLGADYQNGYALFAMPWMGGYTLYGTVFGGMIGVWLSDRKHFGQLADIAVPGAMLMLCIARAAEYFTGEGLGAYLDEPSFFPAGICVYADEDWSEWRVPVFAWEAAAALLLFVLALILLKRGIRAGNTAVVTATLMSAAQIILESFREDELIRFGFVRLNQILAAVMMLAMLVVRICQKYSTKAWQVIRCILFAAGIGGVVAVEFGLDKSTIDNAVLYGFMALMLIMMSVAVLTEKKEK